MNFIQRFFQNFLPKKAPQNPKMEFDLKWIPPNKNQWGVRILDLRPISQTLTSASETKQGADNALSYFKEDGSSFVNKKPFTNTSFLCSITIPLNVELQEGALFIPSRMENKWAIFYKNSKIIVVRSWQREVFVVADIQQENGKLIISKISGAIVNSEEPEEFTAAALQFLIYSHCLDQEVPVPIPEDLIFDLNVAGIWAFQNFGNLAHYGYVGMDFKYS